MPRQDVPYGGAICRLKERIAEIWDKLDQKLHSINGVEGDGAGNVEIVSGDAAITVSGNQVGHYIEIGLDHGNLPSAAVSSVNGQTGAVGLDAADIPSDGNFNVQTDINWCKTAINDCFDSVATEQDDRKAADDVLQTNINAVQASIPEMSATPDPYKGIERDAQGRAFAADPATGATDKTLVTANWVSQTGDSAPNNVAHRNGSETIDGDKRFTRLLIGRGTGQYYTNFWLQNMSIDRSVYDGTRKEIQISFRDMNGQVLGGLMLVRKTASTEIVARVFRKDGTYVDTTLISVTETP